MPSESLRHPAADLRPDRTDRQKPATGPRRFIVDLSDLYDFLSRRTPPSGIQRMLLAFAMRAHLWTRDEVVVGYWDPVLAEYRALVMPLPTDDATALQKQLRLPRAIVATPDKHANRPVARTWYRTRRRTRRALSLAIAGPVHRHRAARHTTDFSFRAGDVLLSLGSGWSHGVDTMLSWAQPAIEDGTVRPIFLVHDLIPFRDGIDTQVASKRGRFQAWFDRATGLGDRFLVYSASTEQDLRDQLRRVGPADPKIERISLAHSLPSAAKRPAGDGRAPTPPTRRPFALVVGSVRGRKNGDRLVEAWAALEARLGGERLPDLVFAGSSRRRDLANPLPRALARRVHFVRQPTDAALTALYESARFCVFPSLYEGWGLPIGEAMAAGRLCVTSRTSSMPEVGGTAADYFDPYDVEDMVHVLLPPCVDDDYLRAREHEVRRTPLLGWDAATHSLFEAAARLAP